MEGEEGEESNLILHCKVCDRNINSREAWFRHLLTPNHSDLARLSLIRNWRSKKLKKRVIVVFTKQPVAKDDGILQSLSNDVWPCMVEDLVWWPERSLIRFLCFETKQIVKDIMSMHKQQVVIDGQLFQLKQGSSFNLDFEWDELLPQSVKCEALRENEDNDDDTSQNSSNIHTNNKGKSPPELSALSSPSQFVNSAAAATASSSSRPENNNNCQVNGTSPSFQLPSCSFTSNSNNPNEPSHHNGPLLCGDKTELFRKLVNIIRSEVEIPDEEYKSALKLLSCLQKTCSDSVTTPHGCEFRIWFTHSRSLKLRHHSEADQFVTVLILLKQKGTGVLRNIFDMNSRIDKILTAFASATSTPFQIQRIKQFAEMDDEEFNRLKYLQYFVKPENGCSGNKNGHPQLFQVVGNNANTFAVEAQLWRLTKYICSFDPRCEQLLQIVYYWANLNSICVGAPLTNEVIHTFPYSDPVGLACLVIRFLCHPFFVRHGIKGRRVPPPVNFLDQPHVPLFPTYDSFDIGFAENPDFRTDWKKTRIEALIHNLNDENLSYWTINLAYTFFNSFSRFINEEKWIISARNGVDYSTGTLLRTNFYKQNDQEMRERYRGNNAKEWNELKNTLAWEKETTKQKPNQPARIRIIHPFSLTGSIPIDGNIFGKMQTTATKLQKFIQRCDRADNVREIRLDKSVVEDLFKLNDS